ncbi:TM2 domain-containing protein [Rathayibacter festucae]|uniref:TM2 domain-containing protein n=1 Tax=Rathayibacter festucae TaxID=110937 RepID=UPI001FB333A9|nr:TM2 domain-containing protein [Rathayibacter festucae]MCJ1698614.1 TM2 domain-containing protein [Rathayibacter festucae]
MRATREATDALFLTAWLLALLLGGLGADRFYLGKPGTAILKLLTLDGLGIWVLVDLILLLTGATRDGRVRPLDGYSRTKVPAIAVTAGVLALSVVVGAVSRSMAPRRSCRSRPRSLPPSRLRPNRRP